MKIINSAWNSLFLTVVYLCSICFAVPIAILGVYLVRRYGNGTLVSNYNYNEFSLYLVIFTFLAAIGISFFIDYHTSVQTAKKHADAGVKLRRDMNSLISEIMALDLRPLQIEKLIFTLDMLEKYIDRFVIEYRFAPREKFFRSYKLISFCMFKIRKHIKDGDKNSSEIYLRRLRALLEKFRHVDIQVKFFPSSDCG